MGTIYSVACKKCKVTRDLDKFYNNGDEEVETRSEALKYSESIQENGGTAFRAALLVSFMSKHAGHDCVFFSEFNVDVEESLDGTYDENDFTCDHNFWEES